VVKQFARHPEWGLDQRRFLHRIDLTADTIELDNVVHPLKDKHFRTLNAADPYALSHEEAACLAQLRTSFLASQKLRDQVDWMVARGRMHLVREGHLIFHGCVPTNKQGEFLPMPLLSERFSGVFQDQNRAKVAWCPIIDAGGNLWTCCHQRGRFVTSTFSLSARNFRVKILSLKLICESGGGSGIRIHGSDVALRCHP